ncbi:MAG: asparagine synthase-related protein [Paludibacteraceae bacterium]|nr:asparagine synthase-related protein [Paludibacteraceae bacterium]
MERLCISINKKKKSVTYQSKVAPSSFGGIDIYLSGDFYTKEGLPAKEKDILANYIKLGSKTYDSLDGTGTVFIHDRNKEKIFVFTDFFNSTIPVFYSIDAENIWINTDLYGLSKCIKKCTLSHLSAIEFMFYAYMKNNRTLIKEIKKLGNKHYLEVDVKRAKIYHHKCRYHIPKLKDFDYETYYKTFHDCVLQSYTPDAAITLSGGFDTNFILHCLQDIRKTKNIQTPIQAYCGGGEQGKDETGLAKQIAEFYGNIDMHTFTIGKDVLQHLPHIVYMLQGLSYERGCFMHYRLSQLFQEQGIKQVYTGDLADQVFCAETYAYSLNTLKRIIKMDLRGIKYAIKNTFDYYSFPFRSKYDIASLILLKKSGQIWNHFGVKGIYPYTRKAFLQMARTTAIDGAYNKPYHRKAVKHILPAELAEMLKRNGGNTETRFLFDEQTRGAILKEVKKMSWYFNLHFPDADHQYDYYIKALIVDIFRRIYVDHEFDEDIEKSCSVPELSKMYVGM